MDMKSGIKIAHVITRLIVGGAQENTLFTVEGLQARGYRVALVSGPTLGPEGSLSSRVRNQGIRPVYVPCLVRNISPWRDAFAFVRLVLLFRRERYDIVHTHSAKAGILGRIAAKCACPRSLVIHTVHGLSFHPYQPAYRNFLYLAAERIAARFTDAFICVGEVMQERSLRAGIGTRRKYTVIYSGFDVEAYVRHQARREAHRRELGFSENDRVVGMIGRLFALKGQRYLLDAFARISTEFPHAKLLLVGDGVLRDVLEKRARDAGIRERVLFAGLVAPERIPAYVGVMDVLAHTSLREGLPKAVAQGFAGGVPVVAFDVDGARELVVHEETGYLVRPGDVSSLADALGRLLANPRRGLAMGSEGQKIVLEKFPVRVMVREIERLYRRLLEKE